MTEYCMIWGYAALNRFDMRAFASGSVDNLAESQHGYYNYVQSEFLTVTGHHGFCMFVVFK